MNGIIAMESRMQRKLHVRFGGGNRADSRSSTTPTQLDETAGPNEAECPERSLALLSPTQNHSALQWRRRCIRNLARPTAKLEDGMRIRFASPIKFTDGYEGQEFFVRKRGRKTALAISEHGSARYRVTNMARMAFSVVPQTKVHRTVF